MHRSVVLAVCCVLLGATLVAGKTGPQACPAGRYLVTTGGPLLAPSSSGDSTTGDAIAVGVGSVVLDASCVGGSARTSARKRFTAVSGRWASCGDGARVVRLKAKIVAPGCTEMRGVLKAHAQPPHRFTATLSTCGDGRFDPAVETCDADAGCSGDATCTAACTCVVPTTTTTAPTTTTTVEPTSTTSTTSTTTSIPPITGLCTTEQVPFEGQIHVAEGSIIHYIHNPPASGNHYPVWGQYKEYPPSDPLPRGYWVHNLEHGAVVMLYRTDDDPAIVDALRAAYGTIPVDPECGHTRTLMTPDDLLPADVPWAIVAHDEVMECGSTVDVAAILDFIAKYRNHSAEDNCAQGGRG